MYCLNITKILFLILSYFDDHQHQHHQLNIMERIAMAATTKGKQIINTAGFWTEFLTIKVSLAGRQASIHAAGSSKSIDLYVYTGRICSNGTSSSINSQTVVVVAH